MEWTVQLVAQGREINPPVHRSDELDKQFNHTNHHLIKSPLNLTIIPSYYSFLAILCERVLTTLLRYSFYT
jgi:hypothetical protein